MFNFGGVIITRFFFGRTLGGSASSSYLRSRQLRFEIPISFCLTRSAWNTLLLIVILGHDSIPISFRLAKNMVFWKTSFCTQLTWFSRISGHVGVMKDDTNPNFMHMFSGKSLKMYHRVASSRFQNGVCLNIGHATPNKNLPCRISFFDRDSGCIIWRSWRHLQDEPLPTS